MILTYNALENFYLKRRACLTNQIPDLLDHFTFQYLAAIFRYPHKMVFYGIHSMTAVSVIHLHLLQQAPTAS